MNRPLNVPEHWRSTCCAGCHVLTWYDPAAVQRSIDAGKPFLAVCSNDCAIASALALARSVVHNDPPLEIGERFDLGGHVFACFNGRSIVLVTTEENPAFVASGGEVTLHMTPPMMATLFWLNRRVVDTFESWVIDAKDLDS